MLNRTARLLLVLALMISVFPNAEGYSFAEADHASAFSNRVEQQSLMLPLVFFSHPRWSSAVFSVDHQRSAVLLSGLGWDSVDSHIGGSLGLRLGLLALGVAHALAAHRPRALPKVTALGRPGLPGVADDAIFREARLFVQRQFPESSRGQREALAKALTESVRYVSRRDYFSWSVRYHLVTPWRSPESRGVLNALPALALFWPAAWMTLMSSWILYAVLESWYELDSIAITLDSQAILFLDPPAEDDMSPLLWHEWRHRLDGALTSTRSLDIGYLVQLQRERELGWLWTEPSDDVVAAAKANEIQGYHAMRRVLNDDLGQDRLDRHASGGLTRMGGERSSDATAFEKLGRRLFPFFWKENFFLSYRLSGMLRALEETFSVHPHDASGGFSWALIRDLATGMPVAQAYENLRGDPKFQRVLRRRPREQPRPIPRVAYRPARASDLQALELLRLHAFPKSRWHVGLDWLWENYLGRNPKREIDRDLRTRLTPAGQQSGTWVATWQSKVIGSIHWEQIEPKTVFISGLAVHEHFRREGIAAHLLTFALAEIPHHVTDIAQVFLDAHPKSATAHLAQKKFRATVTIPAHWLTGPLVRYAILLHGRSPVNAPDNHILAHAA